MQSVILVFNKLTGAYVAETHGYLEGEVNSSELNDTYFDYKTVTMDLETQCWQGDFLSGSIVEKSTLPIEMEEPVLDASAQQKIFSRYRYYHQLNLVVRVVENINDRLESLATTLNDSTLLQTAELRDEFLEMQTFIQSIRDNNATYKTFYTDDPGYEYCDKAAVSQRLDDQLEGGLHELFGREQPDEVV